MFPSSKKNFIFTITIYVFLLGLLYFFLSWTGKTIPWAPEVSDSQKQEYKDNAQKYLKEFEDDPMKSPTSFSLISGNSLTNRQPKNNSTNRSRNIPNKESLNGKEKKMYTITVTSDMKGTLWVDEKEVEVSPLAVEIEVPETFYFYYISADKQFESNKKRYEIRQHERDSPKPLSLYFQKEYNDLIKKKNKTAIKKQESDALARRMVSIKADSYTFEISKYEVTVGEFDSFIKETDYRYDLSKKRLIFEVVDGRKRIGFQKSVTWLFNPMGKKYDKSKYNLPVVHVSWEHANAYCKWLSEKDNEYTYRLPSKVEWILAAYGENKNSKYPWGNNENTFVSYANLADKTLKDAKGLVNVKMTQSDNFVLCSPIESFQPNKNGIFDMIGNVNEWCQEQVYIGGAYSSNLDDPIIKNGKTFPKPDPKRTHPGIGFRFCRVPK